MPINDVAVPGVALVVAGKHALRIMRSMINK